MSVFSLCLNNTFCNNDQMLATIKNTTVLHVIYGHNNPWEVLKRERCWAEGEWEESRNWRERERCVKKLSKKWEGRKGGMERGKERGKRIDGEVGLRNLNFFMATWGQWNPKSEEE